MVLECGRYTSVVILQANEIKIDEDVESEFQRSPFRIKVIAILEHHEVVLSV
jgi:hypothetical protein